MSYRCDLLFNVQDDPIDKAIVAFEDPVDSSWPIDTINEALFHFYDVNDARPWLYLVIDQGLPLGYIVAERDDHLQSQDVTDAFYRMLQTQGLHDRSESRFTQSVPFATAGEWDGVTVGICACPQRFGERFPVDAINVALWKIMGRADWRGQLWIYPVRKENSPLYSGILIQAKVDDMADTDLLDDVMFKDIAKQNNKQYPRNDIYRPERFTA